MILLCCCMLHEDVTAMMQWRHRDVTEEERGSAPDARAGKEGGAVRQGRLQKKGEVM